LRIFTVLAAAALVTTGLTATQPEAQAVTQIKVLFDNAHAETAGNADWIISTSQPNPFNEDSSPTVESDWTGAISAWGVSLAQYRTQYWLDTNPSGRALTYGSSTNSLDLSHYKVVVIPEPNTAFTSAERTALVRYVQNGGGLFIISDHDQSDRNNDGVDSVDIWNQLFSSNGIDNTNPFGVTVDHKNISSENPANLGSGASTHPVVAGPWGTANKSIIRGGTTFTIDKLQLQRALPSLPQRLLQHGHDRLLLRGLGLRQRPGGLLG